MKPALMFAAIALVACGTTESPAPAPASEPAVVPAEPEHEAEGEVAAKAVGDGWLGYGGELPTDHIVPVSALLDDPTAFVGKSVVVEGRVADVCQKAGCWMVVTDGGRTMRVRMKDHGFSVAKDGTGNDCRVFGEVVEVPLDPETVAHFKGEAAKPDAMPEANLPAGATATYEMVASAVHFRK